MLHLAVRHYVLVRTRVNDAAAQTMRNRVERGDEFWFVTSDLANPRRRGRRGSHVLDPTA
jgi:hypothetical protein